VLLFLTEQTPVTLLTVTWLKQSPIYSCQKYLELRDAARLQEVGLHSLKERKGGKDLIAALGYLTGACRKRTRENRHKMKQGKTSLALSDQALDQAPREAEKSPAWEVFKTQQDWS